MERCAPYLAICLRRRQFDDIVDIAVSPWHDGGRCHAVALEICERRWHSASRARSRGYSLYQSSHPTAAAQLERDEEAAGHRAHRR
eukprot:7779112-Pyramimonas_sp.AAC.1